jgi:hypothetical protein
MRRTKKKVLFKVHLTEWLVFVYIKLCTTITIKSSLAKRITKINKLYQVPIAKSAVGLRRTTGLSGTSGRRRRWSESGNWWTTLTTQTRGLPGSGTWTNKKSWQRRKPSRMPLRLEEMRKNGSGKKP